MDTTIKQITPVEYEMQVAATAAELAPKINKQLRAQRANISLKGFRKGKVPMSILKKMFGESLVIEVIEREILEAFQDDVVESGTYKVIGLPSFGDFDYKLDGDLNAILKFGVQPEIEFKDLASETIMKLVHTATDEEIEKEIKRLRLQQADLTALEDKAKIGDTDHVTVNMQPMNAEGEPIEEGREEGVKFFMDDEQLKDELKAALLGKKVGETFSVSLSLEKEGEDEEPESQTYEVEVVEGQSRELPEVDEEFIKQATGDQHEDEAGLKTFVKDRIEGRIKDESTRLFESELMTRMIEVHEFDVPESAIDVFINSFVEEAKRKNDNKLPDNFNLQMFKAVNYQHAEQQARWKLMKDALVDQQGFEVTDEDRKAYFVELSGGSEEMAQTFEQYYANMQGAMDSVNEQLLSKKVFGYLGEQVTVDEKTEEEYLEALKIRREEQEAEYKAKMEELEAEKAAAEAAEESGDEAEPAEKDAAEAAE